MPLKTCSRKRLPIFLFPLVSSPPTLSTGRLCPAVRIRYCPWRHGQDRDRRKAEENNYCNPNSRRCKPLVQSFFENTAQSKKSIVSFFGLSSEALPSNAKSCPRRRSKPSPIHVFRMNESRPANGRSANLKVSSILGLIDSKNNKTGKTTVSSGKTHPNKPTSSRGPLALKPNFHSFPDASCYSPKKKALLQKEVTSPRQKQHRWGMAGRIACLADTRFYPLGGSVGADSTGGQAF